MKLADLRRLSIRIQSRIRFPLRNGMECVVDEHGIAQTPGLKGIPDFNLEEELASAAEFTLETAPDSAKTGKKAAQPPRRLTRDELATMVSRAPHASAAAEVDT